MNYLAHAYLSFDNPEILVGNMISDFIKGKKKFSYSPAIQNGIMLHRYIDTFTDTNEATQKAKIFFKPAYGLYAGAFMDIVYDHFLANDKSIFPDEGSLDKFAQKTYGQLAGYETVFPEKFQRMFHYMRPQNWLKNYRFKEGIYNSFRGLVHRASFIHEHESANTIFNDQYQDLKKWYELFFPQLKEFAFNKLQELHTFT